MMNSRFYLLAAALVTLAACGNDNEMTDSATTNGELVPLQVTGSINGLKTRVTDNSQWEKGDGIIISGTSGNLEYLYENYVLKEGTTSEFIPQNAKDDAIYYGAETGTFSAYYPAVPYGNLTNYRMIIGNVLKQETEAKRSYLPIDFMYAEATGTKENPAVNFKFDHKMSKLVIRLKPGEGFAKASVFDTWYSLIFTRNDAGKLHSKVSFDTKDGTVTPTVEADEISFRYGTAEFVEGKLVTIDGVEYMQYTYIICPEGVVTGGVNFALQYAVKGKEVTYNATLYTGSSKTEMNIEAGKEYVYTVTVNKTKMEVTNATINPWETAVLPDGGNVDAEI